MTNNMNWIYVKWIQKDTFYDMLQISSSRNKLYYISSRKKLYYIFIQDIEGSFTLFFYSDSNLIESTANQVN